MTDLSGPELGYSFLGPVGTFTEQALKQVSEAAGKPWRPVTSVIEALTDVQEGKSFAAMIPIENSVDGGVSVAQDALSNIPDLRIIGEYVVPVSFILVGRPGQKLEDVTTVAAHPVAYAQCSSWSAGNISGHSHVPASSNIAAVELLLENANIDAAITAPGALEHFPVEQLADNLGNNKHAATRFVLVSKPGTLPERTGADKTSLVVDLPADRAGALLELLEQFSTRGVNLSLIQSRPIGDAFGRYRFIIDADGHITDERLADALMGIKRVSPRVIFLGSYPRADQHKIQVDPYFADETFIEARDWLRGIITGEPGQ